MKTIKTADLTGAALDWAVAKCEGRRTYITRYEHTMTGQCVLDADLVDLSTDGPQEFKYSRDWSQGGPIIEQEGIALWLSATPEKGKWAAADARWMDLDPESEEFLAMPDPWHGPTALIAAMRCHVASKLGDEVEVPEELL